MRTARMVENAISNWILIDKGITSRPIIEHNYTIQDSPKTQNSYMKGFDTSSMNGETWFYLPTMVCFLVFFGEYLREKENRLKIGLSIFGVSSLAYYTSWLIFMLLINLLSTGLLVVFATICRFSIFVNTSSWIQFVLLYSLTTAYTVIGMLLVRKKL